MNIKIYFDEDTEYSEAVYKDKDYRMGIIIEFDSKQYKANIYGITRLNQEFNESIDNNEIFYVEPNLIIVKEVTKQSIINSIVQICKEFDFLSQLKCEKIDLSNYIRVY